MRTIISYFILIIFTFTYFIIIIALSKIKLIFERKNNMNTDCINVDYKNNKILYDEYKNKNQIEKEKIFTYCYCSSKLNGKDVNYNDLTFNQCKKYNKYKYNKKIFLYVLSVIETLIHLF